MSSLIERRQRFTAGSHIPWHAHRNAYAAIVLAGGYTEAAHGGRRIVQAGDVIIHGPFSAHADTFHERCSEVVNVPLGIDTDFCLIGGKVPDPEALLRELDECPPRAHEILAARIQKTPCEAELPDALAAELDEGLGCSLSEWAAARGVAPRTLRRHFHHLYGISPAQYRARARARRAWRHINKQKTPLLALAYDLGFSDQAHMSRAVLSLTGKSPRQWRGKLAV